MDKIFDKNLNDVNFELFSLFIVMTFIVSV